MFVTELSNGQKIWPTQTPFSLNGQSRITFGGVKFVGLRGDKVSEQQLRRFS